MEVRDQFRLFVRRAREVVDSPGLEGATNWGLSIDFDYRTGTTFALNGPREEELKAILIDVRHFVLDKEPTFLFRIHNLCYQHIRSDELKEYLGEARAAWRTSMTHGPFRLQIDDRLHTPEYVMDLFINGWYFHSDDEKYAELNSLVGESMVLTRAVFVDAVAETIHQAAYVAHIIGVALAKDLVD